MGKILDFLFLAKKTVPSAAKNLFLLTFFFLLLWLNFCGSGVDEAGQQQPIKLGICANGK